MPNFVLGEKELKTDLEKWLFILKNMSRLEKIPVYLRKPIFQRVFQIAEVGALTKEERMLYDASLKAKRDWNNTVAWAAEQAAEQKSYEVVRNLIADFDFTDEQAAKASQTSIAFVQKVRKELAKKKK